MLLLIPPLQQSSEFLERERQEIEKGSGKSVGEFGTQNNASNAFHSVSNMNDIMDIRKGSKWSFFNPKTASWIYAGPALHKLKAQQSPGPMGLKARLGSITKITINWTITSQ